MKFSYTEKEYEELLKHVRVIHTTNEQKNNHILDFFDKNKVQHRAKALKTGDYTFEITACAELGFVRDTIFSDELCIERKNSVDELIGCIKNIEFHNEIRRMGKIQDSYILVEDDSLEHILKGAYRSQYNKDAALRTLLRWQSEYNFKILFVPKERMGKMICEIIFAVLNKHIYKLNRI